MEAYRPKVVRFVSFKAPKLQHHSIVNKDGSTIYVYDSKLIRLISEGLQTEYEVLTPPDNALGVPQTDGNWSGGLGMITRSEADLAMYGIIVTEERYKAMNFSFPHIFTRITFMTDKPQPMSKNMALFYPFSYEIWILLFVFFVTVALLFYVLMNRKTSLQSVFLSTFGSIFEQSLGFNMKRRLLKMFSLIWILAVMILAYSYKAVLLSYLSFPTLSGIRDISDLSEASAASSFKCITYKGSYLVGDFLESSIDTWKAIGECLNRNEVESEDALDEFEKIAAQKAFVGSFYPMASYANEYFISEDSFSILMGSIPFSRKFCCPKRLNAVIHRIFASGLIDKFIVDYNFLSQLERKSLKSDVWSTTMKINLDDISGAFYILISGWLVSIVVIFAEVLTAKFFFLCR